MSNYAQYVVAALIRKWKKGRSDVPYLNDFDRFLEVSEPTICITHDIDEGYEPNIDAMVDLENRYGVKSTMFLLPFSLPSREWIQRHKAWDFQFHADFFTKNKGNYLQDKEKVDDWIGGRTSIVRAHQYLLPSLDAVAGHFRADSSYNNWTNIRLDQAFWTKKEIVEIPAYPEIEFQNMKTDIGKVKSIWDSFLKNARKNNGLVVALTHPTPFASFGKHLQEFLLTQKGFRFITLHQLVEELDKKYKLYSQTKIIRQH